MPPKQAYRIPASQTNADHTQSAEWFLKWINMMTDFWDASSSVRIKTSNANHKIRCSVHDDSNPGDHIYLSYNYVNGVPHVKVASNQMLEWYTTHMYPAPCREGRFVLGAGFEFQHPSIQSLPVYHRFKHKMKRGQGFVFETAMNLAVDLSEMTDEEGNPAFPLMQPYMGHAMQKTCLERIEAEIGNHDLPWIGELKYLWLSPNEIAFYLEEDHFDWGYIVLYTGDLSDKYSNFHLKWEAAPRQVDAMWVGSVTDRLRNDRNLHHLLKTLSEILAPLI